MRQALLVCSVVLLSVSAAWAGDKVTVHWDCALPAVSHMLPAGDKPDHVYSIMQSKCAAQGEIAGVKQEAAVATEVHDIKGTADRFHGTFVETLANGDKITYTYEGTATVADGKLKSGSNKWSATSGTGRFEGIKASGTCSATPKADGSAVFDCSGDYSIPE